jgi:hypothetical protein
MDALVRIYRSPNPSCDESGSEFVLRREQVRIGRCEAEFNQTDLLRELVTSNRWSGGLPIDELATNVIETAIGIAGFVHPSLTFCLPF